MLSSRCLLKLPQELNALPHLRAQRTLGCLKPLRDEEDMSDSPSLSGTQPYEQWNTTSAMTAARVAAAPDSMLHPILKHLG